MKHKTTIFKLFSGDGSIFEKIKYETDLSTPEGKAFMFATAKFSCNGNKWFPISELRGNVDFLIDNDIIEIDGDNTRLSKEYINWERTGDASQIAMDRAYEKDPKGFTYGT